MDYGRSYLALDVVADDRQARVAEFLRPFGIRSQEDGNAIYHCDARPTAEYQTLLEETAIADEKDEHQDDDPTAR